SYKIQICGSDVAKDKKVVVVQSCLRGKIVINPANHLDISLQIWLTSFSTSSVTNVCVSEECVPPGVECFFDNRCLAAWADILFLCCLPSHLDRICADLHSHLQKHCLVYSFITAVPVNRLAQRLGHSFVLKPQYQVEACDTSDLWLSFSRVTEALSDLSLIEASCPLAMKGGITLGLKWVCGVLYSLLNICTNVCLGSSEALSLINSIFAENSMNNEPLKVESFIASASFLHPNKSFPWISLVDAQTKETPLLHFVMNSKPVQENIWTTYKSNLKSTIK
uniref:NADP-dependent oxidoreductase domain containing 1 n=1 Tax=Poecilia formosa TaxID=48698 RepID=A0A087YCT6_POEFO